MAMKSTAGKAQRNVLGEIIALSVENEIKLEALEQVLVKTNPLVHELYLGQIDTIRKQKAAKLNLAITANPKKS
jgi:hypothetical protein